MTQITKDAFDALPESVQSLFELSGDEYVTIDSLKLSKLKGNLDNVYAERDTLRNQMSEAEKAKADEIANAREEALKEALLKDNNAEATRLLQEKLDDAERRAGESEAKFQTRLDEIAKDKERAIIAEISAGATPTGKSAMVRLLSDYVKVDAKDGTETYFNEDGSASSLDRVAFISNLENWDLFKPLLKATLATNGAGKANGNLGGSASTKSPQLMTSKERIEFKARDPEGFRKAFNLN